MSDSESDSGVEWVRDGKVGQGTYGVVYRAHSQRDGRTVAVKRIITKSTREGAPVRELRSLRDLRHPNVVELIDVYVQHRSLHLVFEFMHSDLERVIKDETTVLTESHVKAYARMLLEGVRHIHSRWTMHRDIKPSNLLLRYDPETRETVLKISDFGLSRPYAWPGEELTAQAITRWYRPPELLFAARRYGFGADMWSCGCVIAEMFLRVPLFGGSSDLDQLACIFRALGTPNETVWPGVTSLPGFLAFAEFPKVPMKQIFPAASDDAIGLIAKLLSYPPLSRGSAAEALEHRFFTAGVPPSPLSELPKPPMKQYAKRPPPGPSPPVGAAQSFKLAGAASATPPDPKAPKRDARSVFLEQLNSLADNDDDDALP